MRTHTAHTCDTHTRIQTHAPLVNFGSSHRPVPSISWQKGNVTVSQMMTEQSGRVLLIPDVQSSDAGTYTCTSTQNGFGTINTTAVVTVIGTMMIIVTK